MNRDEHHSNDHYARTNKAKASQDSKLLQVSATVSSYGRGSIQLHAMASVTRKGRPVVKAAPKGPDTEHSVNSHTKPVKDISTPLSGVIPETPDSPMCCSTPVPGSQNKSGEIKQSEKLQKTDSHSSAQLPTADDHSESLASTRSIGGAKNAKSKLSRIIIGHNSATSQSDTSAAEKSSRNRRPSLGWNQRVSVNTPNRRISEHEVSWIDPEDVDSSSTDSDDSEDRDPDARPSIVVNMDTDGGRKSFALDKLDVDIQEYLAEIEEENSDEVHFIKYSNHE